MKHTGKIFLGLCILLTPLFVSAHPGNTASDGCHYCRTNCDKWGVAWNERHCHNAKPISVPVSAPPPPKPKITPTVAPQTTVMPKLPVAKPVAAPATTTKAITTTSVVAATSTPTTTVPEIFPEASVPPPAVAPEPKRPGFFAGIFKALFGWLGN